MGLLGRLRASLSGGNLSLNVSTTTHASFDINVPAAQAEPVRAALQEWVASKGSNAVVAVRTEGENAHLTFSGDAPNLADPDVGAELGQIIQRALGPR